MALTWTSAHEEKLVTVFIGSQLNVEDVQACFTAITEAGAIPYRKLVDLTQAPLLLGMAGIRGIAQRIKKVPEGVRRGPAAFVVTTELAKEMVATFDHQMGVPRPMAMFRTREQARAWLLSLPAGDEVVQ